MPRVPIIDRQSVAPEAMPGVRVPISAPEEAFGGGPSAERMYGALSNVGSAIADLGEQEKKKADTLAYIDSSSKAAALQTNIQVATSKMLGKDALGAPDFAQQQWQDGVSKIADSLSNDTQRVAFLRDAAGRWDELNRAVQLHVSSQTHAMAEDTTKSFLANSRASAALNAYDDNQVQLEINRQTAVVQDWAARNGYPTSGKDADIYRARLQDELSATHKAVIDARLNAGADDAAQAYFDAHKAGMSAPDFLQATQKLQASKNIAISMDAWNKVKGFTLPDGSPDEAKMQASVMALPGLSQQQKLKTLDFVQAQAKIAYREKVQQDSANDRAFTDNALQLRQSGAPIDQALKSVTNFGNPDTYAQAVRTNYIQKLYAPPSQSDPHTYLDLWEGVQGKEGSQAPQIDQAFQAGKINASDWLNLRKEDYRGTLEGKDPALKYTWDAVNKDVKSTISDDQQRAAFMSQFVRQMQGKSPEEIQKAWQDQKAKAPGTGIIWDDPVWKGTVEQAQKDSAAWAPIYAEVGRDQVRIIGQALKRSGWTVGDIKGFADELGGMQNIAQGTPANNAILSLSRMTDPKGRPIPIVPENIRYFLSKHPDGRP